MQNLRILEDGRVLVRTRVQGPRGRCRDKWLEMRSTTDDGGLLTRMQFRGPRGGLWSTTVRLSFAELMALLKHSVGKRPLISLLRRLLG